MTRFKRRLLIGSALCVLALLGAGVWGFYAFVVAPDAAISRAETHLFRRMTLAQLEEQGTYRFFYVTNRRPAAAVGPAGKSSAEDRPIEDRFSPERQDQLNFGFFDTRIEPTLGIGMIINPSDWFLNEEIKLRTVQALDRDAFVNQVQDLAREPPHRRLMVVVHGFRAAFPAALRMTAFLGHILDINAPVLLFDWPGNQGSSPAGYRRAQQAAKASGTELARTLKLVIRDIQPDRLWLVANSLGGQVVADALGLLHQEPDFADPETEIEHVVLTAPDVDRNAFDQQFKQEITALTRRLTVYVSSNDRALLISRVMNRGQRRRGESTLRTDQLDEAIHLADLIDPGSDLINLVDVTPINRTRNFHNFSLETPEFFDDLFLRLSNPDPPRSRVIYPVKTPEGAVYWVLTSATRSPLRFGRLTV